MTPTRCLRPGRRAWLAQFVLPLAAAPAAAQPASVQLSIVALHAAALTAPRAPGDSTDAPYLLVAVSGPGAALEVRRLPESGTLRIRQDEALGARPLLDLTLAPGDSARLVISALEGAVGDTATGATADAASAPSVDAPPADAFRHVLSAPPEARAGALTDALAPATRAGARWLGSATLLLTNEAGVTYWRALDCVARCRVVSGGAAVPFAASMPGAGGVVELTGAGATYHLQLQAQRRS